MAAVIGKTRVYVISTDNMIMIPVTEPGINKPMSKVAFVDILDDNVFSLIEYIQLIQGMETIM